jgi:SAM-dependent methyltransferase
MYETRKSCRSCDSPVLTRVLYLGEMPLADALLSRAQLDQPEARFPLTVAFCADCSLMQILETVSPEALYCRDYPYYSSFSDALVAHSRENALRLIDDRTLGPESLVVEVASNDGYMLKNFVERGVPVLGIDPAEGPAGVAREAGIPTLCTFFGRDLARHLRDEGKAADVIIANNVLAHVPDQNGLVEGFATLVKDDGVIVIEVPYVMDLVEHCEFDTIYHEHHCYFTVTALSALFRRHGLSLNHLERYPIHGGSLRLYLGRRNDVGDSVRERLRDESESGLTDASYYRDFGSRVSRIKDELVGMMRQLKMEGKRIAAYGAAAKGSTLLNYTGIGADLIDFVVDRNVHKQGLFMPGVHIPIRAPQALLEEKPDYTLLLTWNFKDEILRQQDEYRRAGGRFILPIPSPEVV